ncbi:MAG: MaoC family dehydratase N-terminal domain-containing protein [Pseudomonadota bacterium]
MNHDWIQDWQPTVDAVGTQFGGPEVRGADAIDASAIRRYLEPLELDCALHYDEQVARDHGYDGIVAPCSSILTFTVAPFWQPGEVTFTSAERNAKPATQATAGLRAPMEPPTTGHFATDIEIEYFVPAVVGDHLTRRGALLLACKPKETKVGRGAFLTWESEVVNQRGELVAKTRIGMFRYVPHRKEAL